MTVADPGECLGPADCNKAAAPAAHNHLVPAVRMPPVGHTACDPAWPLGISEDQAAHNPGLDMQDPAGPLEVLGGAAGYMGFPRHMAGLASSPSDPSNPESGFYRGFDPYFPGSWVAGDGSFVASPDGPLHTGQQH